MSDVTAADRPGRDFERYGLLAALTLVILCLLLVDRLRTVRPAVAAPPPDRALRVEIGGFRSEASRPAAGQVAPAPPRTETVQAPKAAPPGPAKNPATVHRTCVVRAGETLGDIASRELGSARRAREIAELNGLKSVDQVRAGQTLRIPSR